MHKCCCFNLKTGGIIIGWIGLVSAITSLCILIPTLQNVNSTIYIGEIPNHSLMFIDFPAPIAHSLTAALIGDQVIQMVMNLSLMFGICKTYDLYLVPWLLMNMLQLIIITIVSLILTFAFNSFPLFIVAALFFTIYLYLWMSVLSLFYQLRHEKVTGALGVPAAVPLMVDVAGGITQHSPPAYVRMEGGKI